MQNEHDNQQGKRLQKAAIETANSILVLKNLQEQKLMETQEKLQKALEEVRRAEAEFSSAFEYAPIGMALVGRQGEILRVNKSLCHLLGYRRQEFLQMNIRQIIHPEEIEASNFYFDRLIRGEASYQQTEKRYLTIEGATIWVNLSTSLILDADGRAKHFVVQVMDITEKKLAEDALKKSEKEARKLAKHYKSILDSQSVYILKTDVYGNYTYVNDYYLQEFGYDSNLIGTSSISNILSDYLPACIEAVEKCFLQPERPQEAILKKTRTDGSIVGGKWEFKGIADKEGKIYEILCVGFDITDQLETLEKTKQLLEISSDQNVKLKSFAYIVSHNIRSHSANFNGLLSMYKETTAAEEKAAIIDMLTSSSNQLEQTIRNLNEIITVHENVSKPRSMLNLGQEIEKTLQIVQGDLLKHQVEARVCVGENTWINCIPAYLDSILLNLITNAIRYRAKDRKAIIEIYSEQKDHCKVLAVKDNGLGIDLGMHGKEIFGMYKRFHDNEDARGLGLHITKTQIEAMGGKIEVESEPGIGTIFKVYFYEKT